MVRPTKACPKVVVTRYRFKCMVFAALWQLVEEGKTGAIRILLVEDDKHLLPLLEHMLLSNGYHVATADSVATGLSILRSQPFDLLITDVNLPDGIGLTIAEEALAAGI